MTQTIYIGDTFPIEVSWFIPSADNPYASSDAVITDARVRVVRNTPTRVLIVDDEEATISGNETIYMLGSEFTQRSGSYSAFVTAVMNDDTTITKRIDFYISPKS